mmetsp:Transcript_63474/g.143174  ORF Transcript_63474/g.143174 Transcript_63474/m.143174 type:complete len:361 (-) Transcript_63474:203-1285(-)
MRLAVLIALGSLPLGLGWLGHSDRAFLGALRGPMKRPRLRSLAVVRRATAQGGIQEGNGVYSLPELYDLAFSYRDFEAEVEFLFKAHALHAGGHLAGTASEKGPTRILEIAAGPARHCLTAAGFFSTEGSVAALDLSPEMVAYGKGLASDAGIELTYCQGDMADFSPEPFGQTFESVWCLLGSAGHLLTNDRFEGMLRSAGEVLEPGGTLVLELPHPRETFRVDDVTTDGWDVPEGDDNPLGIGLKGDGGGILGVVWGDFEDEFEPITQIRRATVELSLERQGEAVQSIKEVVPQREFTVQEVLALVKLSGCFEVGSDVIGLPLTLYGSLELSEATGQQVGVGEEEDAFRLVVVLTKKSP